jgi:LacI family transcriptional regulator
MFGRTDMTATAVFAMNDLMAAGCFKAAQEFGLKIHRDLSIIGFDNREIASYLPVPLTTIQLPNTEIGHESAKMLLALAEGRTVDQNCIILPCKLIERASVASITA